MATLKRRMADNVERDRLEAEKTARRKAVSKPNPTAKFQKLSEIIASGNTVQDLNEEPRRAKRSVRGIKVCRLRLL